jgi:hypothetical protein
MAYNIFEWPDGVDNTSVPTKKTKEEWKIEAGKLLYKYQNYQDKYVDDIPWDTEEAIFVGPPDEGERKVQLGEFEKIDRRITPKRLIPKTSSGISSDKVIPTKHPDYLGQRPYNPTPTTPVIPFYDFNIEDEDYPTDDSIPGLGDLKTNREKTPKPYKAKKDRSGGNGMGMGDLTTGDKIGLASSVLGTGLNAALTIANRLGDRPNENSFLTYAEDALRTMDESKRYAQSMFDYALEGIDFDEGTARRTITQNARGINQQRALQLGLHVQGQSAKRSARMDYANKMLGINREIAGLQERHDRFAMSAEERRLDKDKADRDAFYTNMSKNVTDATMLGQHVGASLNKSLETQQKLKLLNQFGKYAYFDDDFDLVGKGVTDNSTPAKAAPASNTYSSGMFSFNNSINSPFDPEPMRLGTRWNPVTKKLETVR